MAQNEEKNKEKKDQEHNLERQQDDSAGADQVQQRFDKEHEQGFRGAEVDPTPNENYTVSGVTSGAPTPETDDEHAEEVRRDLRAKALKRSR